MACHSQRRAEGGGRTLMAAGGEEGTVATWPKVMAPPRTVCGTTSHPTRILDQNMRCKLDFGNRGAFPGHASNVHRKQKHRSYWYRTKQLRAGGIHAFQVPIMSRCMPPHASGGARIGGLQFSTITAWRRAPGTAAVHSTPLGCRTQSYYRKARRRHPTAAPP